MSSERVAYRDAGAAMRQALERARTSALTFADRRVLDAVLAATVSYSKLDDVLPFAEIASAAACSERQARRSLVKLAALGVVLYRPGLGRGHLTHVGVPHAEESGQMAVPFSFEKSGQDGDGKADRTGTEKRTKPTRSNTGPRSTEKKRTEKGFSGRAFSKRYTTRAERKSERIRNLLQAQSSDGP